MKKIVIILISLQLLNSCMSLKPPKMHLTGKPTVLESQVIGNYDEIEKDAWAISSVKTNVSGLTSSSANIIGDQELFEALKIREFHADKIRDYKNEGALGENNVGLLAYRVTQKYEEDQELKRLLTLLIEEENKARTTIFSRSLILGGTENPTPFDLEQYGRKFAESQQEIAIENDWVQNNSGNWFRKQ
jgi:hypothetical protein